MGFEIAVHAQRGRMRSDLPQQPALDEKPQIVVDGGQGNRRNAAPDRSVNVFRRIVPVGSDDGLINHLTLVGDRQTALRGQLPELFMGEAHSYRIRMIINGRELCQPKSFCDPRRGRLAARPDSGAATMTGIQTRFHTACHEFRLDSGHGWGHYTRQRRGTSGENWRKSLPRSSAMVAAISD